MMISPMATGAMAEEIRPGMPPTEIATHVDGGADRFDTQSTDMRAWLDGLQPVSMETNDIGIAQAPLDDADEPWSFSGGADSGRRQRTSPTPARLLQEQSAIYRRTETISALSNIAQSLKESIRTLTQDR